MEEVLFELLKQSAVVVALGVGNWAQWKEKKEMKLEAAKDREANTLAIKELTEAHNKEKQTLNEYIRDSDKGNQEAINNIVVALETVKLYIKEEKN